MIILELKILKKYNLDAEKFQHEKNENHQFLIGGFFYNQMLEIYNFSDNFLKAVPGIKIKNKITTILGKN